MLQPTWFGAKVGRVTCAFTIAIQIFLFMEELLTNTTIATENSLALVLIRAMIEAIWFHTFHWSYVIVWSSDCCSIWVGHVFNAADESRSRRNLNR